MKLKLVMRSAMMLMLVTAAAVPLWCVPSAAAGPGQEGDKSRPRLALIIDDFGNGQKGTDEILNLPVKLTVAVMPFLPTSRSDAEKAHKLGHDVIIHMPMEPKQGRAEWLGPGAITSKLTDGEIRTRMEDAIANVPHAIGINNHMGSKITEDERIMSVVLEVCRKHNLFYIDSKTNYYSIAAKMAKEKGVPGLENDIFLDDVHTVRHVTKQLKLAVRHAASHSTCIAIGHVGALGDRTAAALKAAVPELSKSVRFVGVSELLKEQDGSGLPAPWILEGC